MKVRVHVYVSGWVQGVFFRSEIRRLSKKNNIFGWVKNLTDGKVEAIFEGEKDNVEKLVSFCKIGPSAAIVNKTTIIQEPYSGSFSEFRIVW